MVHTTSSGEKFTQFPTVNPFVFCYEDHNLYLPRRDVDKMEEWEIKSNLTHQGERSDCTLKKFISRIPAKMQVDIEDLDLFQTNDWFIKNLKQPIAVEREVNMPWVAIQENLFYDHCTKSGDQQTQKAYRFPHISTLANGQYTKDVATPAQVDSKERIRHILQEPDDIKAWNDRLQSMLSDNKPFGHPLKEFLIKPVPYSDITNKPITYCIEFYATYSINVSVRSQVMLYKTPRMYPAVIGGGHWAGGKAYGIGNVITKQKGTRPDQ